MLLLVKYHFEIRGAPRNMEVKKEKVLKFKYRFCGDTLLSFLKVMKDV